MITKLVQGTLLVAAAGIAYSASVMLPQDGPTSTPIAQQGDAGQGDSKKKAKEEKITVWTLHADGKG